MRIRFYWVTFSEYHFFKMDKIHSFLPWNTCMRRMIITISNDFLDSEKLFVHTKPKMKFHVIFKTFVDIADRIFSLWSTLFWKSTNSLLSRNEVFFTYNMATKSTERILQAKNEAYGNSEKSFFGCYRLDPSLRPFRKKL